VFIHSAQSEFAEAEPTDGAEDDDRASDRKSDPVSTDEPEDSGTAAPESDETELPERAEPPKVEAEELRAVQEVVEEIRNSGRSSGHSVSLFPFVISARLYICRTFAVFTPSFIYFWWQSGHNFEIRQLPSAWFASQCSDPMSMNCVAGISREAGQKHKYKCWEGARACLCPSLIVCCAQGAKVIRQRRSFSGTMCSCAT